MITKKIYILFVGYKKVLQLKLCLIRLKKIQSIGHNESIGGYQCFDKKVTEAIPYQSHKSTHVLPTAFLKQIRIHDFIKLVRLTPVEPKAEFNASVFTGSGEVTDLCGKAVQEIPLVYIEYLEDKNVKYMYFK